MNERHPPTIAAGDFATGGIFLLAPTSAAGLPRDEPELLPTGLYVFGRRDALPPDHPLRQALNEDELVAVEQGPERWPGYLLGFGNIAPGAGVTIPEAFDFRQAIARTRRAAQAQKARRAAKGKLP